MKKLDLNEFSLYEKIDWLTTAFGDYDALDKIIMSFSQSGMIIESLIGSVVEEDDEIGDDMLAWYLEHYGVVDAVEYLLSLNVCLEHAVNEVLVFEGMDYAEDEFSYSDWISYRNA